jgi:hypothetical protein
MNIEKRVSIRIIITSYLLYAIYNYVPIEYKLLSYTFVTFLSDIFDMDYGFVKMFDKNFSFYDYLKNNYLNYEYQSWDKIIDLFTYLVVIILAKPFYSNYIFNLLIIFLIWRGIGVIKFNIYNDIYFLSTYLDAVNVIMVIAYLSSIYPSIKNNQVLLLIIGIMMKSVYEKKHHKINYLKN